MKTISKAVLTSILLVSFDAYSSEIWRGLIVKPENRCSPYDKSQQYNYSQRVEDHIVSSMGGLIYGPYTGSYFESDRYTDIEHIVSTSEAHDSGMCSQSSERRIQFASDLLNLTLASPTVNRCGDNGKCGKDAGEWLPQKNRCWFANRVVEVKLKYALSVDRREVETLDSVLRNCTSTEMIVYEPAEESIKTTRNVSKSAPLLMYDEDNNGRITCKEAIRNGIAPVRRSHPAYSYMNDRDGDGVVCE